MKTFLPSLLLLVGLSLSNLANAQSSGNLTFSVTPVAHSGSWGEEHVLAVWIQSSADDFIRTKFRYWGNGTDDHLPNWESNSNGNTVDATTGATLTSYTTKTFTWDGTDLDGALLADGDYKITIEECWSHGPSNTVTTSYTFTKGGSEVHLTPADDDNFTDVTIDWVPLSTGVEDLENSTVFSVFPNPTSKLIYIDFASNSAAANISVVNSVGQEVYSEKENKTYSGMKIVDLGALKDGIYYVNVEVNSKIQTTKIVLLK